ncbi:MAG: hemerythrin domain-containing protein [Hyphomicrobiaceae bacterium]|nr:hemerythrin domain-containing protein [Hyphomicrobiaceae bacterium]
MASSDTGKSKTGSAKRKTKPESDDDGLDILKSQHKALRELAQDIAKAVDKGGPDQRATEAGGLAARLGELCRGWLRHGELDEDIVFPALAKAGVEPKDICQAELQRDLTLVLLEDMVARDEHSPEFGAEAKLLCDMVQKLTKFEDLRLIAPAAKTSIDKPALTAELKARLLDTKNGAEETVNIRGPRHLRLDGPHWSNKEYQHMRGQQRERDERGRFVEQDEDYGRGQGGSRGRSTSSSSRSRYGDDNEGRGWHGDPRGHAEASQRGWDERRGPSRSRDDEDDGQYQRGRSSGGSRGGRSTGGWFGDSEGHSEASRRGWENPNHGDSGWYGDSRGHSQASRRGWQNPDHGDSGWYGDSEGHSQASRRGWQSPDHGDSGWRGDPEGHAEASRRGWQSRRRDDDDDYDRPRQRRSRD